MSRKKWGKTTTKTEKTIREAVLKPEVITEMDSYIKKARSVTPYDLAHRFGIRVSIAKRYLREKENQGLVVPYVRESKFVVYTTPSEVEKHQAHRPIMIADVLEEVASSVPTESIITEEMDAALVAASMTAVKPGRLARQRREVGEKKERAKKGQQPEIVVEPLAEEEERESEREPEPEPKKVKEEAKPAKKTPPKKAPAKTEGTKPTEKKPAEKKPAEKKPAKIETPKKETPTDKKPTPKKEEEKKPAAKTAEKKPKPKVSDITGVGPALEQKLAEAGFRTVASISKAKPDKIATKVDGISEAKAEKMIEEAIKLLE